MTAARPPARSRRRAGGPTVANTQYAMLAAAPGRWTQEDVLLASSPRVRGRDIDEAELSRLRQEYFNQPRACLRASPLPKTFGWGLHYDADGRITLHAVDSLEYAQLSQRRVADPAPGDALQLTPTTELRRAKSGQRSL